MIINRSSGPRTLTIQPQRLMFPAVQYDVGWDHLKSVYRLNVSQESPDHVVGVETLLMTIEGRTKSATERVYLLLGCTRQEAVTFLNHYTEEGSVTLNVHTQCGAITGINIVRNDED